MSVLGKVNVSFSVNGDGLSEPTFTFADSNATAPYVKERVKFAAGVFQSRNAPNDPNNPVRYAFIRPPTGSTNVKTLKGVTGDTGIGATGVGWTSQGTLLPMGNNQAWGILSTADEWLDIYYF